MGFSHCLFLVAFAGAAVAFSGQYIPKSYYVIDENGQKSDVVYIRNRRDLEMPLIRVRRGGGSGAYASSSSQASASSGGNSGYGGGGSGGGGNGGGGNGGGGNGGGGSGGGGVGGGGSGGGGYVNFADYIPDIPELSNFAANFPGGLGGGAGARSFASSSSSSFSGGGGSGGGSGYGNSGQAGGLGAGQPVGYDGPILFSRFGEDKGTGVQVSGSAQGPKAAFSSSSSSVDGNGNVKYSVQSGKY